MSSLLALLGLGTVCAVDSASKNAKSKKKYNQMVDNGAFLPQSGERGHMIFKDICDDWYGKRKKFPKEYWAYLEINQDALDRYMYGLQAEQEIAEGYQPSWCIGTYNKNTYIPFSAFHELWDEKINIFNITGKFYC